LLKKALVDYGKKKIVSHKNKFWFIFFDEPQMKKIIKTFIEYIGEGCRKSLNFVYKKKKVCSFHKKNLSFLTQYDGRKEKGKPSGLHFFFTSTIYPLETKLSILMASKIQDYKSSLKKILFYTHKCNFLKFTGRRITKISKVILK